MSEKVTFVRRSPDSSQGTRSTLGLPPELLEKSRRRIRVVALLILLGGGLDVFFMLVTLATVLFGPEELPPGANPLPLVGSSLTVLASLAMFAMARNTRIANATLINIGLGYEVFLALTVSITNPASFFEDTHALPNLTWVTPLIILFPLIVPTLPRRTLLVSTLAAATRPLGLFILQATGQIEIVGEGYFGASFGPALAVVIAYFGSRVVYGLGLEVAEARRMGSYSLETLLGRGGMGEVWLARHRMLARPAAVKLVRPEHLGPTADGRAEVLLQRFEREAQATAALRSPHTISLYDFGIADDGTFYYVMELLEGFDAETLVGRFGPLSAGRVVHLLRQACHSLAEAHEAGLTHRDIKPANIYVCRQGRDVDFVKVLDFGLVKTSSEAPERPAALTAENVVTGTPAYMAPEQVTGQSPSDARSDIYALGCVAYWLLTAHLVFEGASAMEILTHHARTPARPPSERAEIPVPPDLDGLVLACLDKDPARRPQSAVELSERLAACTVGETWTEERARRWWAMHGQGLREAGRETAATA